LIEEAVAAHPRPAAPAEGWGGASVAQLPAAEGLQAVVVPEVLPACTLSAYEVPALNPVKV